jgi:hypothetical protein
MAVTARGVQLLLLVFSTALSVSALIVAWHTSTAHPEVPLYDFLMEGSLGAGMILALALTLVLRRPEHRVTWVFVLMAVLGGLQQALGGYAVEAMAVPGALFHGELALVSSSIAQSWFVFASLLMVNLFPTGRTLPGGWRLVPWALLLLALVSVFDMLTGEQEVGALHVPPLMQIDSRSVIQALTVALTVFVLVGTVFHLIVRLYRSTGLERQQLKWFVFTFVVGVAVLIAPWTEDDAIGGWLWTLVPLSVLASIALAILRYRLYDIDRIISRTVSYALVVALLALLALALVALLTPFLPSDDPLVVAVATLAAAALFNPLRLRIQRVVDRRFNRTRYVSERVIDDFAGSLRDRVDPDGVVDGWVGVVEETMQPAAVGVWVR